MRKHVIKTFVPMSAVAVAFGMASAAQATLTPVFDATFPASWSGTGTTVTNGYTTSSDTGNLSGTGYSYTTTAVPPDAAPSTGSLTLTGTAGIKVTPDTLLNNAAIASAGGFTENIDFLWDGTDSSSYSHAQKLIDYAGTESLQLVTTATGSATLEMLFANDAGVESTAVSTTIQSNTWYNVSLTFGDTSVVGNDVSGTASLIVNGGTPITGAATKGNYGDGLDRPIGIGEWGYGVSTSIIGLHGDIYSASVDLGVAPEPATLALAALSGLALLRTRRRKSQ